MPGPRRSPLAGCMLACATSLSLGAPCKKPPPPWGQELLANRGFEDGVFAPWQVETGSCEVEYGPTFPWADAFAGDYLFYGGDDGTVASCRAFQEVNLTSLHFRANKLDTAQVGADLSAYLRAWENPGNFDDQVFVRLRWLDAAFQETGSLRTLMVGDDEWVQRAASGIVPAGTRAVRVELESRFRNGADNDGMVDETSLVLNQVTTSPTTISKQPVLGGAENDAMTVMWETTGNQVEHAVEWTLQGNPIFDNEVTLVETTVIDTGHYVHKAVIDGLLPETEYRYRVRSGAQLSAAYEFRTGPAPASPFRIAWFSDNQNGPTTFQNVLALVNARDPDLAIVPGDMVQNGNSLGEWQSHWFDPLASASGEASASCRKVRGSESPPVPVTGASVSSATKKVLP